MPKHNEFPRDFIAQFTAAKTRIENLHSLGRKILNAIQANNKERARLKKLGQPQKAKARKNSEVVAQLTAEFNVSPAFANNAKLLAKAFTSTGLQIFLEDCEESHYVPSREIAVVLARIPTQHRERFIRSCINYRWNAAQLKMHKLSELGRGSKGTKKPAPPTNLLETQTMLRKIQPRLQAIFGTVTEALTRDDGRRVLDFVVPRELQPTIHQCLSALNTIDTYIQQL